MVPLALVQHCKILQTRTFSTKLKDYARNVVAEYALNFQKGSGPNDVKWYGKVEYHRGYKWIDPEVKQGLSQRGLPDARADHCKPQGQP